MVGFGVGAGMAISFLHRLSVFHATQLSVLGAGLFAAVVPAVAFVVRVVPMPYRVIMERLDAIDRRTRHEAGDRDRAVVDLLETGRVPDETAEMFGER
jgi:hypothetical protein